MTTLNALNNVIASAIISEKQQLSNSGFIQGQLSSTIAAVLYLQKGVTVHDAVKVAACVADSLVDMEYLVDMFVYNFNDTQVTSTVYMDGKKVDATHESGMTVEDALLLLVKSDILDDDGNIGDKLIQILEKDNSLYVPTKVGMMKRKNKNLGLPSFQQSDLLDESVGYLEGNQFTVDDNMFIISKKVQTVLGGQENDPEAHVLLGCERMCSKSVYTSEFKADMRARVYQAACSGPNGQASDRSRALMDLVGVPQDYNIKEVMKVIKAEVMDMVKVPMEQVGKLMARAVKDPVGFIVEQEQLLREHRTVPKMYSFVKASFIWAELVKGNRPYIGMAVGLDAKCSGPQLAALMCGDARIAAACGMTLEKVDDAYELALQELIKAGFTGFTRAGVKKSYMGIFYGQGYAAFMDTKELAKDYQQLEVLNMMLAAEDPEETAKKFHKAISKSFGPAMNQVRARFKNYAGNVSGKTSHMMPDGFLVQMNYKVKRNIHDIDVDFNTPIPDVTVSTPNFTHKFIKLSLKTSQVKTDDFVRNGFVNMIQATDALIARLIVVHLGRLGAKHIISVHDCFRVNVTEMHLLEQAIKNAYQDLFGSERNCHTQDLPKGTDILGMYYEGMNKCLVEDGQGERGGQFFLTNDCKEIRKARKINGHKLSHLIDKLGESYYFAK